MSNFLKAMQGSKPFSFCLPSDSIESFYSEFAKFLFLAPVSFWEDYPWDMSDLTELPCSLDSFYCYCISVLTDIAEEKIP